MNQKAILIKIGQILMSEVRDEAIEKFEMVRDRKLKSQEAIYLNNKLASFSSGELSDIREIVINSIDDVIHYWFWALEQHEDDLSLIIQDDDGNSADAAKISDGLSGEIYTENGWIACFSKYKENY